jgi:hypothetical protein
MKIHKSLTLSRIMDGVERYQMDNDNPGFCVACGHEQGGCEPDARRYECEVCGEHKVYGAEELMFQLDVMS